LFYPTRERNDRIVFFNGWTPKCLPFEMRFLYFSFTQVCFQNDSKERKINSLQLIPPHCTHCNQAVKSNMVEGALEENALEKGTGTKARLLAKRH
jgi:hypothetical protein